LYNEFRLSVDNKGLGLMTEKSAAPDETKNSVLGDCLFWLVLLLLFVGLSVGFYLSRFLGFPNFTWLLVCNAGVIALIVVVRLIPSLWRSYRWVLLLLLIVLIFLMNILWCKNGFAIANLEKPVLGEYDISPCQTVLFVETPDQVLYENVSSSAMTIWGTCTPPCPCRRFTLVSEDFSLLFAKKEDDAALQWRSQWIFSLPNDGSALTFLLKPSARLESSRQVKLKLFFADGVMVLSKNPIRFEGRAESQRRVWLNDGLDAGILVSLVTGALAALKQLEEEKQKKEEEAAKRQREWFLDQFENKLKSAELVKTLEEYLEFLKSHADWEKDLKERFINTLNTLKEQTLENAERAVELWKALYEALGASPPEHLERSSAAFKVREGKAGLVPEAWQHGIDCILSLLKDNSESTPIVQRIVGALLPEEKNDIVQNAQKDSESISKLLLLKLELNFPGPNPLVPFIFADYAVSYPDDDQGLKQWLQRRGLIHSPFLDAATPFTRLPAPNEEGFFLDRVNAGYQFEGLQHISCSFRTEWDLRAAVYSYCADMPQSAALKTFIVLLLPSLMIEFKQSSLYEMLMHGVAEQWLHTLANEPAYWYALRDSQQALLEQLLLWHTGGSDGVVTKLYWYGKDNGGKTLKRFIEKMSAGLKPLAALSSLPANSISTVLNLRPHFADQTLFLLTSVALTPADEQLNLRNSAALFHRFERIAGWLCWHRCRLVCFQISAVDWFKLEKDVLIRKCNERVRYCVPPDMTIEALDDLFAPHDGPSAEDMLAQKAGGSLGEMVRLGQKLLLQHVARDPLQDDLCIEELNALT